MNELERIIKAAGHRIARSTNARTLLYLTDVGMFQKIGEEFTYARLE